MKVLASGNSPPHQKKITCGDQSVTWILGDGVGSGIDSVLIIDSSLMVSEEVFNDDLSSFWGLLPGVI